MKRRHFIKYTAAAIGLTLMAQATSGGQDNERKSMRDADEDQTL